MRDVRDMRDVRRSRQSQTSPRMSRKSRPTFTIAAPPTPPTPPKPTPPKPTPTPKPKTYAVKFNANGGKLPKGKSMAALTFISGKAAKLRGNAFSRKGYVFVGWAIRDPLATIPIIAYKNGQKVKNLSPDGRTVKLYAVWKRR